MDTPETLVHHGKAPLPSSRVQSAQVNRHFSAGASPQHRAPSSDTPLQRASSAESSLLLHRPASGRSQDVRHILTRTFRELFTKEAVSLQTVRNLTLSKGGDTYHQSYVDRLQKVYEERESRLTKISKLERHLMEAQARALAADQLYAEGKPAICTELGIPVTTNHYRACVDGALLRANGLLSPHMYSQQEYPTVKAPQHQTKPQFLEETASFTTSTRGKRSEKDRLEGSRLPTAAITRDTKPTAQVTPTVRQDETLVHGSRLTNPDGGSMLSAPAAPPGERNEGGMVQISTHLPLRGAHQETPLRKNLWRQQAVTSQRVEEKTHLIRLQDRANYLKNPRFDPERITMATKQGDGPAFVPLPAVVQYSEYSVGHVYETTLELQNAGSSLEPLRVLPPRSAHFSIGLGQFPGQQGLVAPGMKALYKVRFIPDSLGAYEDVLTIQSQTGDFTVPVVACRPPPVLSLPKVIDCAQCLVRGTKVIKLPVTNHGGAGSFCVIAQDKWPATNFKMAVHPASVRMGPFELTPSVFELQPGETIPVQVLFTPQVVTLVERSFYVVCDNCEVQKFTIKGQGQIASVEFVAMDGGCYAPEPGEICDKTAALRHHFGNLNPFTFVQKMLHINNPTNITLPFEWKVVRPHLEAPGFSTSSNEEAPLRARTLDLQTAFNIHPDQGTLPPATTSTFKVVYAPTEIAAHHSVLHLVLPQIPNQAAAPALAEGQGHAQVKANDSLGGHLIDMTALEMELKGDCVPAQVQMLPYALNISDPCLVGVTVRRTIQLFNKSLSPIVYQWQSPVSKHLLEVTPALGEIEAGMFADLEVSLTGCDVGIGREVIYCHVKDLPQPLPLHINFEVKGPELQVDEIDVNFDLVRFGTSISKEVTIRNQSQMNIFWEASEEAPANEGGKMCVVEGLTVCPSRGKLSPLEHTTVTLHFRPQHCGSLYTFLKVNAEDGFSSWYQNIYLSVRGEVQCPDVCFQESVRTFENAFIDLPVTMVATLVNKTLLDTEFTFGQPLGADVDSCELEVVKGGYLEGRGSKEVTITLTPHRLGIIKELYLPCHIRGQADPLILSVEADVKGLSVTYHITPTKDPSSDCTNSSAERLLNFGSIQVGCPSSLYLHIRNTTALTSKVCIKVNHFEAWAAPPPSPPKEEAAPQSSLHNRRPILRKTPLSNGRSTAGTGDGLYTKEMIKRCLQGGKGLAVHVSQSCCDLLPYGSVSVCLTTLSDMWGDYSDFIICSVGDMPAQIFPLKVKVTGLPLHFQMASHQSSAQEGAMLRLGTHAAHAKPVHRQVKINNTSPVDVRLDWQMFNVKAKDEQLVDFIVNYGVDFPEKDENGQPLPACRPAKVVPPVRPPSGLIPDTPDSSAYGPRDNDIPTPLGDENSSVSKDQLCVTLRAHKGQPATSPCSVFPDQLVIPARRSAQMTLTLDPSQGDPMGSECDSFALGYCSLKEEDTCEANRFTRSTGYAQIPLRLNITGRIKCARLISEYLDDEGLRFRTSASDLVQEGQVQSSAKSLSGTKLTNKTEAILSFRVRIPAPFTFEGTVPVCEADGENTIISLTPNESVQVNCGFVLADTFKSHLEALTPKIWHGETIPTQEKVSLIRKGQERQLCFSECLQILFTNGTIQELPLLASVVVPGFNLNKRFIDFGTCLVGDTRQEVVLLNNRTSAHSHWRIVVLGQSNTCQEDTFEVTPQKGQLEAYVAHTSKSDTMLSLSFTAKDDVAYSCSLVVEGILGEEAQSIALTGRGSFDEKYQCLTNVELSIPQE